MANVKSRFKSLVRWLVLGSVLFFLGKVLKDHWQQVAAVRIDRAGWACLAIALGVTLFAHIWAGWIWSYILRDFKQPLRGVWVIQEYLKTNIAKYLPGNVWHYYGRISAATQAGAAAGAASISVLLEPLLMAAAALLFAVLCSQQIVAKYGTPMLILQWVSLAAILASVHPSILNPLLRRASKLKSPTPGALKAAIAKPLKAKSVNAKPGNAKPGNAKPGNAKPFQLDHYPLIPFLGEMGFVILRGIGFLLTFQAISPIACPQIPTIFGAFSAAWLLGLVIPGAPGGIGVFEATVIALLDRVYAPGILLTIVALYRLISVLSEAGGAGLAWLEQARSGYSP